MAKRKRTAPPRRRDYLVFVSHASADKWIARAFCEKIEASGARTFRDDRDIEGGDSIPDEIRKKIIEADEIDYVSAHATATPIGDLAETQALRSVLGERAYQVPISALKSQTGHMLGGSGAVEIVTAVQTIRTGAVAPTINLTRPDPQCDLDYVPGEARDVDVRTVMKNSFGFGGQNAVLILRRFEG